MTLINTILLVTPIIGDTTANQCAQKEPMQVPDNSKKYILSRKSIGVFFLEEGEVGFLDVVFHNTKYAGNTGT